MKHPLNAHLLAAAIAALAALTGAACAPQATSQPSVPAINPQTPSTQASAPEPSAPSTGPVAQSTASRDVIRCVTTMAVVADPEPPLNVRSNPAVADGNVVDQLENGTYLSVIQAQSGWLQISDPVAGWVAQNRVKSTCNQKLERLELPQGTGAISISDAFVGGGSHEYLLVAEAGQTLTLQSQTGPLPFIIDPNGQPLGDTQGWENRTTWSGQLPLAGEYTLSLDSNYKGYDYTFSVQLR